MLFRDLFIISSPRPFYTAQTQPLRQKLSPHHRDWTNTVDQIRKRNKFDHPADIIVGTPLLSVQPLLLAAIFFLYLKRSGVEII